MVIAPCVRASYVVIDSERCKGCRLCVHTCPKGVLGLDSHLNEKGYLAATVIEKKSQECTGCTTCALMCPDAAITVYRHEQVPGEPESLTCTV